ncbi:MULTISPECIES: phage tail assembly protein [Paenibacillus]|uniref:phage tail assembly protein n=1 Tax=Paenibacillus TaxID=44249 RepID=UPI0011A35202|nr:phage tail assembly protein [Paenibacillus sp. IHBB 10380]
MTEKTNETQIETNNNVYVLLKPINFEGNEIKSLNLDFESLGGTELMNCARLAQQMDPNEVPMVRALSINYQVAVAARAAGVAPELILALKAKDFTQVTQRASNFLIVLE